MSGRALNDFSSAGSLFNCQLCFLADGISVFPTDDIFLPELFFTIS